MVYAYLCEKSGRITCRAVYIVISWSMFFRMLLVRNNFFLYCNMFHKQNGKMLLMIAGIAFYNGICLMILGNVFHQGWGFSSFLKLWYQNTTPTAPFWWPRENYQHLLFVVGVFPWYSRILFLSMENIDIWACFPVKIYIYSCNPLLSLSLSHLRCFYHEISHMFSILFSFNLSSVVWGSWLD